MNTMPMTCARFHVCWRLHPGIHFQPIDKTVGFEIVTRLERAPSWWLQLQVFSPACLGSASDTQ